MQIVAATGFTWIPKAEDWSHTSTTWNESHGALVSEPLRNGTRVGLQIASLTLLLLDAQATVVDAMPLENRTLDEGYAWLEERLREHSAIDGRSVVRPDHELPPHPVFNGAPFVTDDPDGLRELSSWFSHASRQLQAWRSANPDASIVRCWPHHFDIASLALLDPELPSEKGRSIGVGLSPGDKETPHPYWYVNLWPYPSVDKLPPVTVGIWKTEGWIGAILEEKEIMEIDGDDNRERLVAEFIETTTKIGRSILARMSVT